MKRPWLLLPVVLVVLGAGLVVMHWPGETAGLELQAGTLPEKPRPLGDFELVDQHGKPMTRERFTGQWSLAFIGFTHCPDICPATLALLGQVNVDLRNRGQRLQPVFVSVDPERDTPERLREYLTYFGDGITGATGEMHQLERFCRDLDFAFVHVPGSGGSYTIDHSGALALIDQQARLVAWFTPPFDTEAMTADLLAVLENR